jgi:phosphatidylglycerol:prolipoprotein diacylglycerol transferase
MYVVGIIVGFFLIKSEVRRKRAGLSDDDIMNFIMWTVLGGVIGARLYYVVFNWHFYSANLIEIPAVWHGGLAIHGGLIGGATAAYIFLKKLKVSFWKMSDITAPAIILGQTFGRFGNFLNGDAHGTPTKMPWGIVFPEKSTAGYDTIQRFGENLPIHPVMLYELAINFSIFLFLWFWLKQRKTKDGFLFAMYCILYSIGRFFVEFFRADSLTVGPFRTAQIISLLFIVVASFSLVRWRLWEKERM